MAKGSKDAEPLPIYESQPPPWLPKAHSAADLGYVGFFPPRPDQEEEVLTETNFKHGLTVPLAVPAETWSASDSIKSQLLRGNAISELEDLMNQIFARRAENVPQIPSSTFRMPSRVTLNDAKRHAWFTDLTNPDIPLHKLSKNVPHGAKGHDLLDLLHTNGVTIPRAVWFLRVFGSNETAAMRHKPTYNPTQYSVDWANLVTSYLKKQLAEIALPSAPRPGLNIKQTFKGVLADTETRERWMSRFSYSLSLLRTFYVEGLVCNRTFLAWLVQQMGACNLAQLGFVCRLADEYLDGMLISRALTRPFADACLTRLRELQSSSAKDMLGNVELILKDLISRAFIGIPDAFVSPRAWIQNSALLESILMREEFKYQPDTPTSHGLHSLHHTVVDQLADVKQRNEAMLFRHLPPRVLGALTSSLSDIKLLNSLSGTTNITTVAFFEDSAEPVSFSRKVDLLLSWSVTPLQYGDHRPYAAASLLRAWRDKAEERAIRRDAELPDGQLQDQLFDWLDSSAVAAEQENLPAVALLFGQLVKHGLFSYPKYIQRLISRGEEGLSFDEEKCSPHRNFLRWIPLHTSESALINQRKVTLYGVRARETPEAKIEREIRKELRALFPELFGGVSQPGQVLTTSFWSECGALLSAPRYEQIRTMSWLIPILRKFIANQVQGDIESEGLVLKSYTLCTILQARIRCYGSMLEITLFMLEHASTIDQLSAVLRAIRQHIEVWACLNVMQRIAAALYAAHQSWKGRGVQCRPLYAILIEIDNGHYLEPSLREHIKHDLSSYSKTLFPAADPNAVPDFVSANVPDVLQEILLFATDPHPDAPSNLANSLWYKYRTAPDWAWKVWDNTVASLRQIPLMIPDTTGRRLCALRYALFLYHIDKRLPSGFDGHVLHWFLGAGKNEVAALNADAWDVLTVVLLSLTIHAALTATTILQGLIYPVWQRAASVSSFEEGQSMETLLDAAHCLIDHLLLKDECGTGVPPADIFEAQGLQTRRRDVFREPHFPLLVANFPTLVLIEQNPFIPDALRQASHNVRLSLCQLSVFRQGIYHDLDAVRLAFEKLLESRDIPDAMHDPLVNALRLMLSDSAQANTMDSAEWQATSMLSPWKLAATAIQTRLTLKQFGENLVRDSKSVVAFAQLNNLTTALLHHFNSPEEADFVAEMITDVSSNVAGKFVNAGLQRVTTILKRSTKPLKTENLARIVGDAGEILRLLANIVEPFRNDATLPDLVPAIQDEFVSALFAKFADISDILGSYVDDTSNEGNISEATNTAVFLARLLQFSLGFPGAWTNRAKELSTQLFPTLTRLVLLHGAGPTMHPVAFPLFIDTLYYALDEVPVDPKAPYDPFRHYPNFALSELPSDMPSEYRQRLRSLLPYVLPNIAVQDLAFVSHDASGAVVNVTPVQNRPWEWTEYLGDPSVMDAAGSELPVKNSTSLSLDLFDMRITADRVLHPMANTLDPLTEAHRHDFQDDLSQSIFQRDWRETRVVPDDIVSDSLRKDGEDDGSSYALAAGQSRTHGHASSRRGSPVSSSRSRGGSVFHSSGSTASSLRQSPVPHLPSRLSVSTASEVIDVDMLDMLQATKRKVVDDDEVEIVDGPVPRSSKRPKIKAATKSRAKKK